VTEPLPSKIALVGVITVETSDTESFRIVKWFGEIGGEADLSEVGFTVPVFVDTALTSSSMRG
jgi:hypothetical protein